MRTTFPLVMTGLILAGIGAAGWLLSGSLFVALLAALVAASFVRPGGA